MNDRLAKIVIEGLSDGAVASLCTRLEADCTWTRGIVLMDISLLYQDLVVHLRFNAPTPVEEFGLLLSLQDSDGMQYAAEAAVRWWCEDEEWEVIEVSRISP